eukprot:scaffold22596_cov131-Cylindrotheca_fusiformis.AAC.14
MAKKRNRQRDAGTALSSKDEPFLDKTIIVLGAVLVVLIGILVVQVKDILLAYRDMTRDATTGSTADDHGSRDYRGVARLRPQPGVHLEVASFVDRNEPFVCRHCLPGKGLDFWASDDNLLQTVEPDASIPVRVAQRSKTSTLFRRLVAPGGKNSAYDERIMPFSKFLQHYGSEDSEEHWYGAQIPILSHLPQLLDPIRAIAPPGTILEAIGPDPPESHKPLSMYIGHGPLSTQTHYDSLENFVCVTSGGQKTFQLFDPATASLYMYIDREVDGNGAPVFDHDQSPTLQGQYPLSKYAIPTRVTLEPGDCLYVPVYWYHSVESSSDRTISINWWRMPTRSKMLDLEHLFCGHNESSALAARAKCN